MLKAALVCLDGLRKFFNSFRKSKVNATRTSFRREFNK